MNVDWQLPDKFEAPFREALDHAAKRDITQLHALFDRMTDEQLVTAVGLCGFIAAYTAIDVVERRWPTDAGVRRMAEKIAEAAKVDEPYGVTEQNVYLFLSRCALKFEAFPSVFADIFTTTEQMLTAPFFLAIDVLAGFLPKGKTIWEFLDVIEDAYEKAWLLDLNLLPALMVRARMPQPGTA